VNLDQFTLKTQKNKFPSNFFEEEGKKIDKFILKTQKSESRSIHFEEAEK